MCNGTGNGTEKHRRSDSGEHQDLFMYIYIFLSVFVFSVLDFVTCVSESFIETFYNKSQLLCIGQQHVAPIPPSQLTEQQRIDLRDMFPCNAPSNPSMRSQASRASSFVNWIYTRVTPGMLAEAGFFSLGTLMFHF